MRTSVAALIALSGLALALVSVAHANPVPDPVYTFCETEDNDLCSNPQILDANLAAASVGGGAEGEFVRDCFYLTGKLQLDCVWDIEPKCAMKVYDKPAPCRTTSGSVIPNQFYEPVLKASNGEDLINVVPLSDRTIRLGVAALQDAFDGTINGLANNGPHNETGEVTVKIFYHTGGDGQPRGDQPDQSYVFKFGGPNDRRFNSLIPLAEPDDAEDAVVRGSILEEFCESAVGSDAVRVAFIIPSNVTSVDIVCCNNTGTEPVCYDVDHYKVTHLLPGKFYDIEVIGGTADQASMGLNGLLTDIVNFLGCEFPTNTKLGWFDKNCNLLAFDDNIIEIPELLGMKRGIDLDLTDFVYSKLFATAEEDGSLRFAVSGGGFAAPVPIGREFNRPKSIPDNPDDGSCLTSGEVIPDIALLSRFRVDQIIVAGLDGLVHPCADDLKVTLRHNPPGDDIHTKRVQLFRRPGAANGHKKLDGDYFFADSQNLFVDQTPQNFEAAVIATAANAIVPDNVPYLPVEPLSSFVGDPITGRWAIEVCDLHTGDVGTLAGWQIIIIASDHGDCDFDGLDDNVQQGYFDLLERLRIVDGLNFVYRPGASTKDASIDDVIRYPRAIWDPASNQNLHGEAFLATYGGAPEPFYGHGVCGGYCIKIQLAEHIDPSDRPEVPMVMNSARADINSDGVVNASDLALLLSYWGIVQ